MPVENERSSRDELRPSFARRPTFPKVNRKYILEETLRSFDLPFQQDPNDPEYIIILCELDIETTDILFNHTSRIRDGMLSVNTSNKRAHSAPARRRDDANTGSGETTKSSRSPQCEPESLRGRSLGAPTLDTSSEQGCSLTPGSMAQPKSSHANSFRRSSSPPLTSRPDPIQFPGKLTAPLTPESSHESLRNPTRRLLTFPKVHRDHVAEKTLRYYDIPYKWDPVDPEHFILLREMDHAETDMLFEHTSQLRNSPASKIVIVLEFARERLAELRDIFELEVWPQCKSFKASPPPDPRAAERMHRHLSDLVLRDVLVNVGAIMTEGDDGAAAEKELLAADCCRTVREMDSVLQ